ncbi:MAG: translation initiation factor IF-2 [bacterium]|nr:translation initiation factor IF-2 [bacterium]
MLKVRVYELAKRLGVSSHDLLDILKDLGVEVKSHFSNIDEEVVETVEGLMKPTTSSEEQKVEIEVKEPEKEIKETIKTEEESKKVEPEVKKIQVPLSASVREVSELFNLPVSQIIMSLMNMGILANINQELDQATILKLAEKFNIPVETGQPQKARLAGKIKIQTTEGDPRAPIVTVLGHVDHGKTTLLDTIRKTNVTATEAGGITQHIGAYQVEIDGRKITFIDTPGHEAFTALRARGARITDIAILVVAADDGVMPQTIEAIDHAKAAEVPIVVAINKIDKPEANVDRVKTQLSELGLIPEEWGGDTIMVPISAKKNIGIDQLLEMVLLLADIMELKAKYDVPARGTIIETVLDRGKGPVAIAIVMEGTLKVGDIVVTSGIYGKVRALFNDKGEKIKKAVPSTPVQIVGLPKLPIAGESFVVVSNEKKAKELVLQWNEQVEKEREVLSLENVRLRIDRGELKSLNLILKADTQGSLEAIEKFLKDINIEGVSLTIVRKGVGNISEGDVLLAKASKAIILGFNVDTEIGIPKLAENEGVSIKVYNIIYELIDDITLALKGLLKPEKQEVILGRAEVRQVFRSSKIGNIAGCYVIEGKVVRNSNVRIKRDGNVIFEGKLSSLKRFKEDAREVLAGYECGIFIEGFGDYKEKDIIECYTYE